MVSLTFYFEDGENLPLLSVAGLESVDLIICLPQWRILLAWHLTHFLLDSQCSGGVPEFQNEPPKTTCRKVLIHQRNALIWDVMWR